MIHPDTELRFINEVIGYGVFATKFIPKGTITWIMDDLEQKLDEAYVQSLDRMRQEQIIKYCFRNRQGKYVLSWDIAKYVNHSFNANCIPTAYDFEIAIGDIEAGEELTNDYASLNLDKPLECLPEPGITKTTVTSDDFLLLYPEWDRKAAEAMKHFNWVEQPLEAFITDKFVEKVRGVATGKELLDSVICDYYDRQQVLVRA